MRHFTVCVFVFLCVSCGNATPHCVRLNRPNAAGIDLASIVGSGTTYFPPVALAAAVVTAEDAAAAMVPILSARFSFIESWSSVFLIGDVFVVEDNTGTYIGYVKKGTGKMLIYTPR